MTKSSAKSRTGKKRPNSWKWAQAHAFEILVLVLPAIAPIALWLSIPAFPTPLSDPKLPDLSIALAYSRYLSRSEEGTIDMTVTNMSATQAISGTVTVVFRDFPPIIVLGDTSNAVKLEALSPGGKQALHLRYNLALTPTLGSGYLEFFPRASIDGIGSVDYDAQRVDITFMPSLRTSLSAILLVALGIFGDQLKQRLFPSK